jgi:hypothetical protein
METRDRRLWLERNSKDNNCPQKSGSQVRLWKPVRAPDSFKQPCNPGLSDSLTGEIVENAV